MKTLSLGVVLAAALWPTAPVSAQSFSTKAMPAEETMAKAKGDRIIQGQWKVTADGCTYSRAQAPGYPPSWYLVLNPHHVGMPTAHRGCKPVL